MGMNDIVDEKFTNYANNKVANRGNNTGSVKKKAVVFAGATAATDAVFSLGHMILPLVPGVGLVASALIAGTGAVAYRLGKKSK